MEQVEGLLSQATKLEEELKNSKIQRRNEVSRTTFFNLLFVKFANFFLSIKVEQGRELAAALAVREDRIEELEV